MRGRRLGQRHDEDVREVRVRQTIEEGFDLRRNSPALSFGFLVVGPCGVEQQQRVSGGSGVENHELVGRRRNSLGERSKDRDFRGARRAKILTEHYAQGRVEVRSAGSEPGSRVNSEVAAVLDERGLGTDREVPTLLTSELVEVADVVVTMGCGETCPFFPGKRYLDWVVDDPAGQNRETVRRIVEDIDVRVRELLLELGVEAIAP